MPNRKHPHPHSDELRVFFIPAEQERVMELVVLPNRRDALSRQLSASELWVMNEDLGLPALDCGCPLSMALSYEGTLDGHTLAPNLRASLFLSDGFVFGDVLMVGQGIVQYADGRTDVDFISLTPEFHGWQGPGHPVPPGKMPWES